MKITAIKQQVKNQGRYSIFVDEKYSFSLSELGLINSGLTQGQELSKEELDKLKDDSVFDKLYNRTLNLLSRRARSEWEIRDYLKRHDSPTPFIDKILNKLSDLGYVDDFKFAEIWVANRRLLRPTSRRKLQLELRQKHVPTSVIEQALAEDETEEGDELRKLVEKKRARYPDKQKFMRYLAGQGFQYDDIKNALNEFEP